jgi:hypothetical protein
MGRNTGKDSSDFFLIRDEPDSAKWLPGICRQLDSEIVQCIHRLRHQSLAAGLVDGRVRGIGNYGAEAFATRGDCGGEPGWTAANYKDVSVQEMAGLVFTPCVKGMKALPLCRFRSLVRVAIELRHPLPT